MASPDDLGYPHCAHCGYCLRGLTSSVCPECGRPLVKNRPLRRSYPSWIAYWIVGLVVYGLSIGLLCVLLVDLRNAELPLSFICALHFLFYLPCIVITMIVMTAMKMESIPAWSALLTCLLATGICAAAMILRDRHWTFALIANFAIGFLAIIVGFALSVWTDNRRRAHVHL